MSISDRCIRYASIGLVIAGFLLGCCTSCQKQKAVIKTTGRTNPVQYPSGWPLSQLNAPMGSLAVPVRHGGPGDGKSFAVEDFSDSTGYRMHYAVAFTNDKSWGEVSSHIESCLGKEYSIEADKPDLPMITFRSQDNKLLVTLLRMTYKDVGSSYDYYELWVDVTE